MLTLTQAKVNAEWFRTLSDKKLRDVEREQRLFKEAEAAAEKWEATVQLMKEQNKE